MKRPSIQAGMFCTLLLAVAFAAPALASDNALGKKLVGSSGCTGCHVVEGNGGKLGPALDGVGKRLDDDKIMQKLLDPKAGNPQSMMPAYGHLSKEELKAIVDYLEHL